MCVKKKKNLFSRQWGKVLQLLDLAPDTYLYGISEVKLISLISK